MCDRIGIDYNISCPTIYLELGFIMEKKEEWCAFVCPLFYLIPSFFYFSITDSELWSIPLSITVLPQL